MNPHARDKTKTRAGVDKPDLSCVSNEFIEAAILALRKEISERASLKAYLEDQLKKRRKKEQKGLSNGNA